MIYVFLVLLAAVVAWRIILPGMRLEPRAGAGAAPAAPTAPMTAAYQWMSATRALNIALVAAGVVIFSVGVYNPTWSNPHPATIGSWGRGHWFTLLILWGIGAALIWLNASERAAKTLQTALAGVMAAILVVFPLLGWTTSPSVAIAQKQERAQPAEAGTFTMLAGIGEKSKRIPVPFRKRVVMTGEDFRFHCVYGDGHEESFLPEKEPPCRNGDLPFVYATNLKNEENVVAYAYAGPQQ